MAGINISGFLTNSFDWQTTVDKLIEVSSTPKLKLEREKETNLDKLAAYADIKNAMLELQESVRAMWDSNLYTARTVTTDATNSTWRANSSAGAEVGSYRLTVSQLATSANLRGIDDIGAGLSGSTVATLNTATAITAGTFTINGHAVTITETDSLEDVLTAIGTATGNQVEATYDAGTDKIVLTSAAPIMVGAANDTSNFLMAMQLSNNPVLDNGTYTVESQAALGTVRPDGSLDSAGLRISLTDPGTFTINGVEIAYDPTVDSLNDVLNRITNSAAGVVAGYDPVLDQVTLSNGITGDYGINVSEASPGLLAALGLPDAGAVFTAGQNARFSVNGSATRTSASNTLDAAALGVTGLSVTVNTETEQTLNIATDTNQLEVALQDFIEKYNAFQALIDGYTEVSNLGDSVSSAILAGNREVENWGTQIRALAFDAVTTATGSVKRLDDLGLDFSGTENVLVIKDTTKLVNALMDHPEDVAEFFQSGTEGFTARMYNYLTAATKADGDAQSRLSLSNIDIDEQIDEIQRKLDTERELLTSAFLKMQDAQSKAQSQSTYLTNTFFRNNTNN